MINPYNLPLGHWHLEPSSKCTLRCPRCPRVESNNPVEWMNKEYTLDFFTRTFTTDLLTNYTHTISMVGDVGDPIYCRDLLDICRYIKETNPRIQIQITTNGSYKSKEWWGELGSVLNENDIVVFSIDGYDNESNNLYRVNSNWDSIITGLTSLTSLHKCYVKWAAIAFKFNQDKIEHMIDLARNFGCDEFRLTKSTKFGSKYSSYITDLASNTDELEPDAKWVSESGRYEKTITVLGRQSAHHGYINSVHRAEQLPYTDLYILPGCRLGERELYVSATGQLYPCSWVATPHNGRTSKVTGKFISLEDSLFRKHEDKFNLNLRSIEEVISDPIWEVLTKSFKTQDKAFVECEEKCINPCNGR